MKKFQTACVIGRFQPFHRGHLALINRALEIAERVIVLVGSSGQPRTIRNPFSYNERAAMIDESVEASFDRFYTMPLHDSTYDLPDWQQRVQSAVASAMVDPTDTKGIVIVGCNKDASTSYLTLFPQWKHIDPSTDSDNVDLELNATKIRDLYFSGADMRFGDLVTPPVDEFLASFKKTDVYQQLKEEHEFIKKYREAYRYAGSKHEPSLQTVDAVVIQGGHVLLIQRKSYPGKGLMALPGGFVNKDEKLEDAVIRELFEETQIDVPQAILRSSIVTQRTFDEPHRDQRGRVYTQAFLIDLDSELENRIRRWGMSKSGLSKVKGGDDAARAKWVPISQLDSFMYGDHYHVIKKLLSFKK